MDGEKQKTGLRVLSKQKYINSMDEEKQRDIRSEVTKVFIMVRVRVLSIQKYRDDKNNRFIFFCSF